MAEGEWYHCYNRGVDKRKTFLHRTDYERFLLLLLVANSPDVLHISNMKEKTFSGALIHAPETPSNPLVEIGAYCLMPNHFHVALKEVRTGGIASLMQKVCTGYTMYFNKKNERTGSLFAGTYKSKHVADDSYIKQLISYIHCNPVELFDPNWKESNTPLQVLEKNLLQYQYSSLAAFLDSTVPEIKLLGPSIFELYDNIPSVQKMLLDTKTDEELIKV